jgi:hypothetical protein
MDSQGPAWRRETMEREATEGRRGGLNLPAAGGSPVAVVGRDAGSLASESLAPLSVSVARANK